MEGQLAESRIHGYVFLRFKGDGPILENRLGATYCTYVVVLVSKNGN